jgi:hypothetical protein
MSVFVSDKEGKEGFCSALSMELDAARNEISHLSIKGRLTVNAESFC